MQRFSRPILAWLRPGAAGVHAPRPSVRCLAASAGGSGGGDSADDLLAQDAALAGVPPKVHQLIGDPRTGVADDTTTNPFGELTVEHVWHQESNFVNFFRYAIAGKEILPYMHMDPRLSDHSKNLMYLLRAKDPHRWTVEALAAKFRIRRQRVLSILLLKDMEAQAIKEGRLLAGPLRPYAFDVLLSDVHLDPGSGEPVDLGTLTQAAPSGGNGGGEAAGWAGGAAPDGAASALGSLTDFLAQEEEEGEKREGGDAGAASLGGASDDLGLLMPRVALAAQRLQLRLLQLLQRHAFSCDALEASLLSEVTKAEAYFAAHIAGTPAEAHLLASAASAAAAAAAAEASSRAEEGGGDAGGEDGAPARTAEAAAAAAFDFEASRRQVSALVSALRPLTDLVGAAPEREGVQLAERLRRLLSAVDAAGGVAAAAAAAAAAPAADAGRDGEGDAGAAAAEPAATAPAAAMALESLEGSCREAGAEVLARAFALLDPGQRRQLLALAPDVRRRLTERGIDLAAAEETAAYWPPSAAAAYGAAPEPPPPLWPGQVPPLVDLFRFRPLPAAGLDALLAALRAGQAAAAELDAAAGGGAASEGGDPAQLGAATVESLRGALDAYQHLNRAYDMVVEEQARQQSGAAPPGGSGSAAGATAPAPAPLPAPQRRTMLRLLREVDPSNLEKLSFWESYYRDAAAGRERESKRLRRQIRAVLRSMAAERGAAEGGGGGSPPWPELQIRPGKRGVEGVRYSHDLVSAYLDVEVVGRVHHRGSGERHFVRPKSYPAFEGLSLQEFDSIDEGELSKLSRLIAEREDDMMWREFQERVLFNLGLSGPDLQLYAHHARPQKPRKGFGFLVHPYGSARAPGGPAAFVAPPGQSPRPLNDTERVLQARRTPKPRRRWFLRPTHRS